MSEIFFLLVGFLVGFCVCLGKYYEELSHMTIDELAYELEQIRYALAVQVVDNDSDISELSEYNITYPPHTSYTKTHES